MRKNLRTWATISARASRWTSARARARGGKLKVEDNLKVMGDNERKGK